MKLKFKVIKRTHDDCEHDTGVIHSIGTSCKDAERMIKIFGMNEDDPDHNVLWHNEKMNPYLTIIEG